MAAANLESNHAMLDVRDGLCKRLAARGVKFDQIPKDMKWPGAMRTSRSRTATS